MDYTLTWIQDRKKKQKSRFLSYHLTLTHQTFSEKTHEQHWPFGQFQFTQLEEGATYDWFDPPWPFSGESGGSLADGRAWIKDQTLIWLLFDCYWQALLCLPATCWVQLWGRDCVDMAGLIQAVFWCYCRRNLNLKKAGVNLMTTEKELPLSDSSTEGT